MLLSAIPTYQTQEERTEAFLRLWFMFPVPPADLPVWTQGLYDALGDKLIVAAQQRFGNHGWVPGTPLHRRDVEFWLQKHLTRDKGIQKRRAAEYARIIREMCPYISNAHLSGIPRRLTILEMVLNEEKG
jgi:hypothetical protein